MHTEETIKEDYRKHLSSLGKQDLFAVANKGYALKVPRKTEKDELLDIIVAEWWRRLELFVEKHPNCVEETRAELKKYER
jgi:hypothetical protein